MAALSFFWHRLMWEPDVSRSWYLACTCNGVADIRTCKKRVFRKSHKWGLVRTLLFSVGVDKEKGKVLPHLFVLVRPCSEFFLRDRSTQSLPQLAVGCHHLTSTASFPAFPASADPGLLAVLLLVLRVVGVVVYVEHLVSRVVFRY